MSRFKQSTDSDKEYFNEASRASLIQSLIHAKLVFFFWHRDEWGNWGRGINL